MEPFLGAVGEDVDVREPEIGDDGFDKTRLLLRRVEQGKTDVRKNERKRDAREARAGAGIDDVISVFEETPRKNGIEDVFDGGLARVEDAREVHHLVDFDNQVKVARAFGNDVSAVGEIFGEEGGEFGGECHPSILALSLRKPV